MDSEISSLVKYFSREKSTKNFGLAFLSLFFLAMLLLLLNIYMAIYSYQLESNIEIGKSALTSQSVKRDLLENYDSYSDSIDKIYTGMTSSWNQPNVVRNIEQLAKYTSVQVIGQNYRQFESNNKFDSYLINITATGHYPNLKSFIGKVSGLRGKALIDYIKLSYDGGNNGLSLALKVKVYYLKNVK